LCKDCRRQLIRDYANLGCIKAVRDLVVPLTINGARIRDIERLLFLSTNTILKTLREAAKRADEPAYPRRVRDLEMDEFWSFVGAKRRQRWTWYGTRPEASRSFGDPFGSPVPQRFSTAAS
jgi:insertion element IS1 protein InsB